MKFFIDLSKKQLIKSAASNVALERVVLKRRDSLAVEVVFVTRNAVATMPAGTTVSVALKKSFSDSNFLASASGTPPVLNLNTVPLEALFSATAPSTLTALLEIRWQVPGETTRTATLQAEIQNSVILGTEATPEAIPDGKATQAEAITGTDNTKWMTPLRTAQAIAVLAPPPTWDAVQNKPELATLVNGLVPSTQLPSYVDDVLEFANLAALPATGETGKIYITLDTRKAYRWTGSQYLEISPSEVTSVAGRTGAVTLATADITSASVRFEITGSHPPIDGFYEVWDIDYATGHFRWASDAAYAGGASWTALRWNPATTRWELGTYTAFTTWTPHHFHTSPADIPPATGWQSLTSHPEGTIIVSGAGTAAANGPYTPTGTLFGTPPRPTYTGPNGFSIHWNGLYWHILQGGNPHYFNGVQFEVAPTPDLVAAWQRTGSGTNPAPAVTLPPPPPTLQWFQQGTDAEILALNARDSRLQQQLDDQGGIASAAIQTLSTNTADALALKADLLNGLVPATQLPPISYQTTRYDGDGTAFTFAPPGVLTASDSPSAISVTINGVTQEPGSDYTLNIATNRVVLTSALDLGDKIVLTRALLLPSNSALTAEQLGALTATSTIDGGSF